MTIPDSYFSAIWGRNPAIPKTIMTLESDSNIDALGDSGLAFGLFQEHPDFIETWWPALQAVKVLPTMHNSVTKALAAAAQGSPVVWRDSLAHFLAAQYELRRTLEETLLVFHYGHIEPLDPDKYIRRFKAIPGAPATWQKEVANG